jgi:flagellar protein FliS
MLPNAYQQYQESQVFTASKGKLLLMTYDGAIRFIRQAQGHMAERRYEDQNACILKAQRILLELMSTLDSSIAPELAQYLLQLYEYLFNRLIQANVSDDLAILDEVLTHMAELRHAWAEADREMALAGAGAELYAAAA